MLRDPKADPDQVGSYVHLPELMAGEYAAQLNSIVTKRYTAALTAAMTVPPGEARHALLTALSSAVGTHLRNGELMEDKERLTQRLATEMPDAQLLEQGHQKVRVFLRGVTDAFKKAWAADKARGMDMSKSSMAWFEHELLTYAPAIQGAVRDMVVAGQPKTP